MGGRPAHLTCWVAIALLLGLTASAEAFPGLVVGRGAALRSVHTTHVVLLAREPLTVVTVMVDYEGPLDDFAVLLPVPGDVEAGEVRTVKREFVARLEELTAPRFHEFYEADPCDPEPPVQAWEERILPRGSAFLDADDPDSGNDVVSRDIAIPIVPEFKAPPASELTYQVIPMAAAAGWVGEQGFTAQPGALAALARTGLPAVLVARVDPSRVELVGGSERAQLAGVRYVTALPHRTLPATLGLVNAHGEQDLFVYVLHPTARFETKNYPTRFPPTNLEVTLEAKEKLAELYNALHDQQRSAHPTAFWCEHVWRTEGCGEPCPNAPLTPRELLSLGGDVVEARLVTAAERDAPLVAEAPGERAQREARLAGLSPSARAEVTREAEATRREVARRRALMSRHRYVLTRLHHRYDRTTLPRDVVLGPAPAGIRGGSGVPRGKEGVLAQDARPDLEQQFQVRAHHLHPQLVMPSCPEPRRWRWGRRWPELARTVNKVFLARDLPAHRRDPLLLGQVVVDARAAGLASAAPPPGPATRGAAGGGACGCRVPGHREPGGTLAALALGLALVRLRQRAGRVP